MKKIISKTTTLLSKSKYLYTPVSNYKVQNKINPIVAVTISNGKTNFDLQFRLFENTVPKTTENFKRLLLGTGTFNDRKLSLIGNPIFNLIPRAYLEFGHLAEGNCSIYGPKFRDQSFQLPHDRPGLLSCVSQQNTNNSRFLITFAPCPFLDLKNIVFGELTAETIKHLTSLQRIGEGFSSYKIVSTQQIEVIVPKHEHHDHHH